MNNETGKKPEGQQTHFVRQTLPDSDEFDMDDEFDVPDTCPMCDRQYDEIDQQFQFCSKCGWDAEDRTFGKPRQPKDIDYMSGEADILTGTWY